MLSTTDKVHPDGLLLSDDLIFTSRVTAEARAQGLKVESVGSTMALIEQLRQHQPRGILLDLAFPGLDLNGLFMELRAECTSLPRMIAYGPHVEVEALRAARAVGCDPVLPRSKFVEALGTKLGEWLR